MDIDIGNVMPFDMGRYLVMLFVSGGFIMVCFYFWELMQRQETALLIVFTVAGIAGWQYYDIGAVQLPFFN